MKTSKEYLRMRTPLARVFVAVLVAFVGGALAGGWVVRNQIVARTWDLGITGEWSPKNTALLRLESSVIQLPNFDAGGGGIHALDDGRIFYATRTGQFGVIGIDGTAEVLPFTLEMNLDALQRHPVFQVKNFNYYWVRITDINLRRLGSDRYELLVGHHYFQEESQCMELRLSRAVLSISNAGVSLSKPFRTVLSTKPCITFYEPGYEWAFEGHFSGGRIAPLNSEEVLFSTGDHGWVGLRGYPALSQDDTSTLGKILRVRVATNESTVFAKGIRNPQGLTVDSKGRIWETEQGPRGGDELNLIVEGQSYGWPDSTYGTDYGPRPWPLNPEQGVHKTGTTPQFAWNPSIAVSNLIEVTGNEFPLWKGDLLVLSLVGQTVHRLRLDGTRVVYDEPITFELNRLRDIAELPSGQIALLTDHGAVILLRNSEAHGGRPFMQQQTTSTSEDLASKGAENNSNSSNAVGQEQQFLTDSAFRGESVFKANCASCHSLAKESTAAGPSLNGIVGRRVGSAEFPYSAALTGRLESWTSRQIVDFATHPNDAYSGTIMMPVPLSPDLKHDLESYLQAIGH